MATTEGRISGSGAWERWFAPLHALRPRGADVLVAAFAAAIQGVGTVVYSRDELPSPWELDGFGILLLLAGPIALLVRRRWPEASLAVAFVAAAAYAASGYPRGPSALPALTVALVTVIMIGERWVAWGLLAITAPTLTALTHLNPDSLEAGQSVAGTATNLLWMPLAAAAAEILRIRLERSAEQEAAAKAELRRRADAERLQVARELHDVLAHTISLINVQSGIALHLLDEHPEHVRPALDAINTASEEALGELQWVLDVLHRGVGGEVAMDDETTAAPRSPTPSLRDVNRLVQRTRSAGVDVQMTVAGVARPVPAPVDLAAYRILQEALTNVIRHAGGGASAIIELRYEPTAILVQVADDGLGAQGRTPTGEGRGLAGMRQRIATIGGSFTAGPRPGCGFIVRARLPFPDMRR